jgi:hypothetical protein
MARPYANPYLAGMALGGVLLSCFVLTGQGLGASGAFASAGSALLHAVAPRQAGNTWFQGYLQAGPWWSAWLVIELLGVIAGAAVSAWLHGRLRLAVERPAGMRARSRLAAAGAGGILMGIGSVLACGCTSGQALSGGALLSAGSWTFMLAVFISGYATMPLLRRLWP